MTGARGRAARIAAATPAGRDRYLDFLRVVALLLVVVGHWLVRVVIAGPDGAPRAGYLLAMVPGWQAATLLWQVMPLFFLVGGVVNAASWRRARAAGASPDAWAAERARRLLWPMLPLLAVLVPAAALVPPGGLVFDLGVAILPLWFLAAYLAVTALTPWALALHEAGRGAWLFAAGGAAVVALDLLRFLWQGPLIAGQPAVAAPNFLLVWLLLHQIGFLWADGRLPRRPSGQAALAAAAAAVLAAMIGAGPWPLSMVPIEATELANNGSPPSAALILLGLVQGGLALLLRGPVTAALRRPWLWAPVAVAGAGLMQIYLWHQPALVLVANLAYPAGLMPLTAAPDAGWWALRPLWLALCTAVLLPLVLLGRLLTARVLPDAAAAPGGAGCGPGRLRLALGVGLVAAGIAGLIATRLVQPAMPLGLPLAPLAALLGGLAAIGLPKRGR